MGEFLIRCVCIVCIRPSNIVFTIELPMITWRSILKSYRLSRLSQDLLRGRRTKKNRLFAYPVWSYMSRTLALLVHLPYYLYYYANILWTRLGL